MKKVILVKFFQDGGTLHSKDYSYFTDEEFKIDDIAVVDVSGTFKCVQVTQIEGLPRVAINAARKWIVQRVDVVAYEEKQRKEAVIAEIRNQLRDFKDQAEEYIIYQQLAKVNPGIKKLMSRLHELDPEACPPLLDENGVDKGDGGVTNTDGSTDDSV